MAHKKDTQLALQEVTREQKRWLVRESKRTKKPITVIVRELIQEKVDAS